ncbi:MAG: acyltransferase family protein [Oscillospiraceae bacterium]
MPVKKERQSNIELLRIFTMLGVVILHYNNPAIGKAMTFAEPNSIQFFMIYFFESLFICAVDLFILISGYFMCQSMKRDVVKPCKLILQVILYSCGVYLLRVGMHATEFSVSGIIRSLIPNNYFVILYVTLYFVSVYINVLLTKLNEKQFQKMLFVLFLLFSVWNTLADVSGELIGHEWIGLSTIGMYGSQYGYSIVNFCLMYLLGAYIRKFGKEYSTPKLLACISVCCIVMLFWAILNDKTGYFTERSAWEYCNPVVILEACAVFCLFKNMHIGTNRIINTLSSGAFSVFLLQNLFLTKLPIEKYVRGNIFIFLLHMILSSCVIYLICCVVDWIYTFVIEKMFNAILKNRNIPMIDLSESMQTKDL